MTTNAYKNTLHVYTPNDKDFARKADSLATALYEAAEQKAYQELSREELFAFLDQAASLQDSHTGLLKLCIDDMMPADMRMYLWYNPTYAASVAGMYAWLHYPEAFEASRTEFLRTLLNASIGRGFSECGPAYFSGVLHNLDLFLDAGLRSFLDRGAAGAVDFRAFVENTLRDFRQDVERANQNGNVLHDRLSMYYSACQAEMERLLALYDGKKHTVFVYGTLMRDRSASYLMKNATFCDSAVLHGYVMYDLGDFPGIVPDTDKTVLGEVWFVDDETLAELDRYEDEGALYRRTEVKVSGRKGSLSALAYVYQGEVHGDPLWNKWGTKSSDSVWYAGYGSNLSPERFRFYIQGGVCPENGKKYDGCEDKTLWSESHSETLPGTLYFGNYSPTWGGGVAFLKPYTGKTYFRVYRITCGQLMGIREQEGDSKNWYGRIVFLGFDKDGIPMFTLTSAVLNKPELPTDAYLGLLVRTLAEEGWSEREIARYLWEPLRCGKKLLLRDVCEKVHRLL